MFLIKIDKIFKDLPNVSDIADDISIVGYNRDGKGHDETLQSSTHMQKNEPLTK